MFVCVCNSVTDRQIRKAADEGVMTLDELSRSLNVGTCCGRCKSCAKKILDESMTLQLATSAVLSPALHAA